MFRSILIVGLALFAAACVPIPAEPPAAAELPQTSESPATSEPAHTSEPSLGPRIVPAIENRADCPDRYEISPIGTQVVSVVDYLEMLPGQSANDPVADNIPAYVDMTRVESTLEGEILTAVFHLREIPEELEFNRKGVDKMSPEYMWMVHIDADGKDESESERYEYTFGAFSNISLGRAHPQATTHLFEDGVQIILWEHQHDREEPETRLIDVPVDPRLIVSHEDNTLTLVSEVPGITSKSVLMFSTFDTLLGHDGVSCQPDGLAAISKQDEVEDVSHDRVAHIDIRGVTTDLDGETLTVTFQLRDLPETLTFNRTGVPKHALEYNWEVSIDVDNDPETGSGGFDYMLSAGYFVHPLASNSDTVAEITQPGFVKASLWGLNRQGYRVLAEADIAIEVSAEENTITLSGEVPGITEASRLRLRAYDFFAGSVEMRGHGPSTTGLVGSQCKPDHPSVTPGQTVLDAAGDVPAAHIDIIEIKSSLSEEILTVVFRLRDVPETLTFNRTGVPEHTLEYIWEVSVDVDNDRTTGSYGFDYALSTMHFVSPRAGGINSTASIETPGILQTHTWELDQHDAMTIAEGRLEVSSEDNTITLSGKVPGISAESRLAFGAIDYLGGTEEVGCFLSNNLGHQLVRQCTPYDAPVRAGSAIADDVSDVPAGHIDITAVDTSLSGETLTAVFHLRDVPEALTFDRAGVPDDEPEYRWGVFVDADNDPETGWGGIDYTLSAVHKVSASSSGSATTAPIAAGRNVQVSTRKMTPGEGFVFLEDAYIEVSAEDNTITLSGEIPDITTVSPLAFEAYDYSGGTEMVGCLSPVPVVIYEDRCDSEDAMIAPGQTVIDGITDTLPAYMDITEVSTVLDGETLAVVFHLRDVPETLEFNRKTVPQDALEYTWNVSVDVVDDGETGLQGADYSLSASHFVFSPSSDEGVHLPIGEAVQANSWQVDESGDFVYLSGIGLEVSPEEDTITLIGDIPGITSTSRLEFETYDFLHGSEQVICQVPVVRR